MIIRIKIKDADDIKVSAVENYYITKDTTTGRLVKLELVGKYMKPKMLYVDPSRVIAIDKE